MADFSHNGPIVILTGAGISRESGLSTFRDSDGLWAQYNIEDVATPQAFARNPQGVHEFYNLRRRFMSEKDIRPNAAHHALVRLERDWPGGVLIITQNIDDLHEQAGSKNLIHMHGQCNQVLCSLCGDVRHSPGDLFTDHICKACNQAGGLRPNVVWFGETPYHMDRIAQALVGCGLFISIGTSGTVYPAAGFVDLVSSTSKARIVELNLEPSKGANQYTQAYYGPASEVVPVFIEDLLALCDV